MTGLRIELRRGPALWTLPLLIAVGVASVWSSIRSPSVWSYATFETVATSLAIGPLAAGVAAFAGRRGGVTATRYLSELGGRNPLHTAAIEAGAVTVGAVAAFVGTATTIFLPAATQATWGAPSWLWLLTAIVGLCVFTSLGFVIGRLVPFRLTPLIVAAATFVLAAWNQTNSAWWRVLVPAINEVWLPFSEIRSSVLVAMLGWHFGAIALCWAIFAALKREFPWSAVLSAGAGVALVVSGVAAHSGGRLMQLNQHIVWTCTAGTNAVEVCVHPAFANSLPEVRERTERLAGKLQGTPFALSRVEQRPRGVGGEPTAGAIAFGLDADDPIDYREAMADIARQALFYWTCFPDAESSAPNGQAPAPVKDGVTMADLLLAWALDEPDILAFPPGTPEEAARLALFSRGQTEQTAWLNENALAIQECVVSPTSVL